MHLGNLCRINAGDYLCSGCKLIKYREPSKKMVLILDKLNLHDRPIGTKVGYYRTTIGGKFICFYKGS